MNNATTNLTGYLETYLQKATAILTTMLGLHTGAGPGTEIVQQRVEVRIQKSSKKIRKKRHKAVYNGYYFYFILSPCQEFPLLYFKRLQNCKMHLVTSSIFPWYQRTKSSLTLPHSHQSLNMFKSCLVKHGLKLFPS